MCAFTSKSDRWQSPTAGKTPNNIGPGTYVGHASLNVEHGYAPFGSTKTRATAGFDPAEGASPGDYDPKLPHNFDPGLPKKTVPFHTSAPRDEGGRKSKVPGPGSYEVLDGPPKQLSCRTMGQPHDQKRSVFRSSSAPSIPRAHQCFGYEEVGGGHLVRQVPKEASKWLSGVSGETTGPGHYEPFEHNTSGGRFLPVGAPASKKQATPGPGHYDAKGQGQTPLISSSFLSTTSRSRSMSTEFPGPGDYAVEKPNRKNMREQYSKLQYFRSTTERFKQAHEGAPGPGAYREPARRQKAAFKPFCTSDNRFKTLKDGKPGPGTYDPEEVPLTSGALGTVSILGSTGSLAFGSMQSKRPSQKGDNGPGPGAYNVLDEEPTNTSSAARKGRPKGKIGMPSCVFKSTSAKDALMQQVVKEGLQRPPPGAYDPIPVQDTTEVLRLPVKDEGFLSTGPRNLFNISKLAPGPGRYCPQDPTGGKRIGSFNRTILEGVPHNGRATSFGFETQDARFKRSKSKMTPGPGAYHTESELVKRSHNVEFGDVT